jgi:hyperosmotically inducible periplasmic protein
MKKLTGFLISSILLLGAVGCDVARTSGDAPTDPNDGAAKVEDATKVTETKDDGQGEVRRKQLESDIRAREQRNEIAGDPKVRADSDLESEIRSKLEANIPRSQLTVEAKDGNAKIIGTVPSQEEYDKIMPLAKEIKGVNQVTMEVKVVPATES